MNTRKIPNHLEEIKKRLIEEPLFEQEISRDIVALEEILDNVSNKVREQYEENPYPRWVKGALYTHAKSIAEVCNETGLKLFSKSIKDIKSPKVLVAGCGTGQHLIEVASGYRFNSCDSVYIEPSSI